MNRTIPSGACGRREHGSVLIVAMWVILVLVGLVMVFARAMRIQAITAANYATSAQARAIARGALQFVVEQVATDPASAGDVPCEARRVGDGYFWILRADPEDDRTYGFGIVDEGARVNLNSASEDMLLKLPGMTAELAAAVIDWRDPDSDVSPGGAENEYYLLLEDPHYCKDDRFETVDELLLVKGATPEILPGEDVNRNGVLDDNENDADDSDPPDNRNGRLDGGLYDYLTVYSREPNLSADGEERIDINDVNTRALSLLLRDVVADDRFFQIMNQVRARRPFQNVIDFYFGTGLAADEFRQIVDRLATTTEETVEGLVNINTAPRRVLACLPGLDESDVDQLIAARSGGGVDKSTIAWVTDVLPRDKAIAVGGDVSTKSYQFSADIVALSGDGRAWKRYRAVIDALESPPRVALWQDLTHLGWPLAPEVLSAARSGSPPEVAALARAGGRPG